MGFWPPGKYSEVDFLYSVVLRKVVFTQVNLNTNMITVWLYTVRALIFAVYEIFAWGFPTTKINIQNLSIVQIHAFDECKWTI